MSSFPETGMWITAVGVISVAIWQILQYLRKPAFVSRSRLEELYQEISRLRAELAEFRAIVLDLKKENSRLTERIRELMTDSEFWRDLYKELKSKNEKGAP